MKNKHVCSWCALEYSRYDKLHCTKRCRDAELEYNREERERQFETTKKSQ